MFELVGVAEGTPLFSIWRHEFELYDDIAFNAIPRLFPQATRSLPPSREVEMLSACFRSFLTTMSSFPPPVSVVRRRKTGGMESTPKLWMWEIRTRTWKLEG